jgi:hypothetical protein
VFAGDIPWIDTSVYSPVAIAFFGAGCVAWAVAYLMVIRGIVKNRFVEIPAAAVQANIAWEVIFSFVFPLTVMGRLFLLGYQLWFVLDLYINYSLFKYGHKQVLNATLRQYFRPLNALGILAWLVGLYFFMAEGYDTQTGAVSAYVLTVIMAFMYVVLFLSQPDKRRFSAVVAWSKLVGNLLFVVFVVLSFPGYNFMFTLCALTFIFDAVYVYLIHTHARQPALAVA